MTISGQTLRAATIALLVPILWGGCRNSEATPETGALSGVDSMIIALSSDMRSETLVFRDSGLPWLSVSGDKGFYNGVPGGFKPREFEDTMPIRTFAIVDSTTSWGMVQLQWAKRSRDIVLESRNRLVFDGRWDADTFVASLRKGERLKGCTAPPGCMCQSSPPWDFFARLSFEDRPRIWLRLVRKGVPGMLIRWDSSGARVVGADSVTAKPISTFEGGFVRKCHLFCRGNFFCSLP